MRSLSRPGLPWPLPASGATPSATAACLSGDSAAPFEGEGERARRRTRTPPRPPTRRGGADPDAAGGPCALRLHPETFADLKAANDAVGSRVAADSTADYVAATRKRARLAEPVRPPAGHQRDLAPGRPRPARRRRSELPEHLRRRLRQARRADLRLRVRRRGTEACTRRWPAAACGSRTTGARAGSRSATSCRRRPSARSPTPPAGGGTLIAVTGDNAFAQHYAGVGVYWSTDDGRTWQRAKGVPAARWASGSRSTRPIRTVVYAATGPASSARPTTAAASPTSTCRPGDCAGNTSEAELLLRQRRDRRRGPGARQVRPQGRRRCSRRSAGARAAARTSTASPRRPRTASTARTSGAPGTFTTRAVDSDGLRAAATASAASSSARATGPEQNHGYIYADRPGRASCSTRARSSGSTRRTIRARLEPTATPTYLDGDLRLRRTSARPGR